MMSSVFFELIGSVPREEGPRTGIRKRAMSNTSALGLQTHTQRYIVKIVKVTHYAAYIKQQVLIQLL